MISTSTVRRIFVPILLLALVASCAAPAASPAPAPTTAPSAPKTQPTAASATKPAEQAKPAQQAKPTEQAKPAGASVPAGPPTKIKVVVLQGTQMFPALVMEKMGFDKKYNLQVERHDVLDPPASYNALRSKEVDMGYAGWVTTAQYRTKGADLVNVYSMNVMQQDVMVKKDSPLKSFADLKGKRVGVFGGAGGTSAQMIRLETSKFFGFDLEKESQVQYSAPPLLIGLLDKGEIDAALLLDPFISKMLASGKYRSIGDIGAVWQDKMGFPLLLVCIATNDEFAKKNPEAVKNFIRAWKDSAEYLKTHAEIWPEMAAKLDITDPEEVKILRERVSGIMLARWDDTFINQQLKFAEMGIEMWGADFLSSIPKDAFTTKYVP